MSEKLWTHLKLKNGDKVKFIPPAPNGDQLGGVTQQERNDIESIKTHLSDKLTQPESVAVGKYFRVSAVDEAGHAVLEAVDLPVADTNTVGGVKVRTDWSGYGIGYVNATNKTLVVSRAGSADIDEKASVYKPIVPAGIDRAVRAGLLSNSQITEADKPQICETIGAERKGRYELLAEVISDGSYQTIPFAPCTDVFVEMAFPANTSCGSGTLIFNRNNSWVSNQANAQISLGAVTSANYVKKGNTRAFLRNGYWTYEHISPGGGGSAPVTIPAYDNYLVASEVNLPCCRSILINVADFPKGVTIKVWGVQTTDN